MKQIMISPKKIVILSLIAGLVAAALPASAFTSIARGSEGLGRARVEDLANKDLAVLSNNPLYFFKTWRDNIVELFISDDYAEASFDLRKAGERAGEVRKLVDVAPDDAPLLSTSLGRYAAALSSFQTKLTGLQVSDLGEEAESRLTDMTGRLLTQLRFVDDMREVFTADVDAATLAKIEDTLIASLRFIVTDFDTPELFSARIANIVTKNSDAATAVRVTTILAKLIQDVAGTAEAQSLIASVSDAREILVASLADAIRQEGAPAAKVSVMALNIPVATVPSEPKVSEVVDQLADDTLKAEITARLH